MDAPRPLPSWVVVERIAPGAKFDMDRAEEGWGIVNCKTKSFHGCGKYGCLMAEGLTLYARLTDEHPDHASFSVGADERFHRSMVQEQLDKLASEAKTYGAELAEPSEEFVVDDGPMPYMVEGYVEIADKKLIILTSVVSLSSVCVGKHYLVYDATHASMSMIPYSPADCCRPYFESPLPVRDSDEYALVLIARNLEYQEEENEYTYRDVLCLWPPPPSSRPPPPPPRRCGDTYPAVVPRHFKEPWFPEKMWPAKKLRTMGCTSGGSVKFVTISFDDSLPVADRTVTEWTLDTTTWQWSKSAELRVGALWQHVDFKKHGLPDSELLYPLLSTEEDDDGGALCFVLSEPRRKLHDPAVHHMCRFDMGSKRIVLSSRLSWSPFMVIPAPLMGCAFFRYLQSQHLVPVVHGEGKRKLNEN